MENKIVRKGKIYSLSGPDGIPFYVGCTISAMAIRLSQHVSESAWQDTKKAERVRELDFQVSATILEVIEVTGTNLREMNKTLWPVEKKWIEKLSKKYQLVNRIKPIKKEDPLETVGAVFTSTTKPKKIKALMVA